MKKNYLSPEISTTEFYCTSVLCGSGDPGNAGNVTGDNNSFSGGAPARKVF